MKFEIKIAETLPDSTRTAGPNAHEFQWAEAEAAARASGKKAWFTIPTSYWTDRGDSGEDLKVGALRTRIRNHFNAWAKKDASRADVVLHLASVAGGIDAYVSIAPKTIE